MAVLPSLPADSVHCAVTSPPYFALRSYLPSGHPDKAREIGSEPTPDEFLRTMVAVFRQVRRVLHPSGTLWVNLGDSYNQYNANRGPAVGLNKNYHEALPAAPRGLPANTDAGQLLNIPHRVAEALRADGWLWRQTIVWAKKTPMPESVSGWRWVRCRTKVIGTGWKPEERPEVVAGGAKNRAHAFGTHGGLVQRQGAAQWNDCPGCPKCLPHGGYVLRRGKGRATTAHEYIFLFAKSPEYFYDSATAVEASTSTSGGACVGKVSSDGPGSRRMSAAENSKIRGPTRNYRSVWTLSSEPTTEKHFAAYPSALVEKILRAGTSAGGCCPECLVPWAPVVESTFQKTQENNFAPERRGINVAERIDVRQRGVNNCRILAYRPTCTCGRTDSIPCTVLDPFAGTGTTLQTAKWMGRSSIGIELNSAYIEIAERRIQQPPRWLLRKNKDKNGRPKQAAGQKQLF
jgi:site-specific DNA-methyltransferase (cytosine-N4-specific)